MGSSDLPGAQQSRLSDAYQRIDDARLQTLLVEWNVRWLPVGIYADAVTQRFFRKAMMAEEDL